MIEATTATRNWEQETTAVAAVVVATTRMLVSSNNNIIVTNRQQQNSVATATNTTTVGGTVAMSTIAINIFNCYLIFKQMNMHLIGALLTFKLKAIVVCLMFLPMPCV